MPRQCNCSWLFALGCITLASSLLLPPRLFADPLARPTPLLAAAQHAVAKEAGAMKERRGMQAAPAPSAATDLRAGSFFKSKAGIATLLVFGAGVGYAIYSSSNDRIRSTGR